MKVLRELLDRQAKPFEKGGPLERFYPLWEAGDTFAYSPPDVTKGASHVRDGLDLKRMMSMVIIALLGCIWMAMYNTGLQAHLAISAGAAPLDTWQSSAMEALGFAFDPASVLACAFHGALYYLPVLLVTFVIIAPGGILGWFKKYR